MKFSIVRIYGVKRDEYCRQTGITKEELIKHLCAELEMLNKNLNNVREQYRKRGKSTTRTQKYRAKLISVIQDKINKKKEKINDILRNVN